MAYVYLPDVYFNDVLKPCFHPGAAVIRLPQMNRIRSALLATLGFSQGLVEVELREPPDVSVHQTGFAIRTNATARPPGKKSTFILTCEVFLRVDVKGNRLVLLHRSVRCQLRSSMLLGKLLRRRLEDIIVSKVKKFLAKVEIPQPKGVTICQMDYHDGALVVWGNISTVQDVIQKRVKLLLKRIGVSTIPSDTVAT